MENNGYKVISNISMMRKKVFLTIVSFLLALAFVIAIFVLIFGKKTDSWLDGTSGMSRASVFPFVFTSGDNLYIVDEDLSLKDIDNNTTEAVLDNNLKKVYYIYNPSNELYEYDIKEGTRTLLCSGVSSFKLFKERSVIPYVATDGSIYIYSFNTKSSLMLRGPLSSMELNVLSGNLDFILGRSSIVYFDEFDLGKGTAVLKQWLSGGDIIVLNENALYSISPVIFSKDQAVGYYTKEGLCVSPKNGDPLTVTGKASLVRTNDFAYAELLSIPPSGFDSSENIMFYYTESELSISGSDIYEFDIRLNSVTSKKIAENVHDIINYSRKYSILIYSVIADDKAEVYFKRPGSEPSLITTAPIDSIFYYDASSDLLYVIRSDNTVKVIDAFDKLQYEFEIPDGFKSVAPYFGKPFSVIYSNNYKNKTIVLKQSQAETYPSSEIRLYGKSDNVYLKARTISGKSTVSLDIVNGAKVTRITNSCTSSCIVFDKDITNVLYCDKGALYAYKNGERSVIGEFDADVMPVDVLTE